MGELINLKMDDVHKNEGLLKVMGKGKKERIVPMGSNAQRAIQRYLFRYRPKPAHPGISNVFLSVYGKPLTENSLKLTFARLATRISARKYCIFDGFYRSDDTGIESHTAAGHIPTLVGF